MLERYEFEVLSYLEREGQGRYSVRQLSDTLCISGTAVMECLKSLKENGFIEEKDEVLDVTSGGLGALEPYRVKHAVILAAGFGSRMMPATADRPKPMVRVNGIRLIDTLLDALTAVGITDITVVGGYRFEKLGDLLEKYPFLRLLDNKDYARTNNISSAVLSSDYLKDGCYYCEADLYITNPQVITKYQYASNILGSWSMETDDWSFRMDEDGHLINYRKGNTFCYNYYGIAYWSAEDCRKLREDFAEIYQEPDGRDYFWEFIPFVLRHERYQVEIRQCRKQDIMEIDNYYELAQLDHSYALKETK